MPSLSHERLLDVIILVGGLVVAMVVMSIHHPYTATILSMAAAAFVVAHMVVAAWRSPAG